MLVRNAAEQRIIKRIVRYRERKAGPVMLKDIVATLNKEGIRSKTGAKWTIDSVQRTYKRAINRKG